MTSTQSQEEGWWGTACKTGTAYARMSATIIISVLMRLMLDAIGFVCLGETKPSDLGFWFAKCIRKDGDNIVSCLSMALYLYLVSMLVAALVMYFIAPGVNNPMRNPFARRYSLAVLLDAVSWFPISVAIGKINLFQEAFENVAEAHTRRECVVALKHIIINLEFVVIVTGVTAILAHISLKYVKDVARAHASGERSFRAFLKVFVQVGVSTIPWLVGWSCWKLVLSILDLFECDWFSKDNAAIKVPSQAISFPVLMLFNLVSVGFYIRFGPEPVIPNPETQQAVYRNPYVGSVKRTLMSLAIYIAMVFVLMTIVDVEYGILYKFFYMVSEELNANKVNPLKEGAQVRLRILSKFFVWFCTVTVLCIAISLVITIMTSVDMNTSSKLSRQMISCQFQRELPAWPPQRSPARHYHKAASNRSLGEGLSQELQEGLMPEGMDPDDEIAAGQVGDEVVGPDPIALLDGSDIVVPSPPPAVSAGICASVMAFDVLGFTVCTIWAAFAKALYAFILGMYADIHPAVYLLTMAFYCFFLTWGLLRFVFLVFPSAEELAVAGREEFGEAACCAWWSPTIAWLRELASPQPAKRLTWSGSECESDSSVFLELRDQQRHSLSS